MHSQTDKSLSSKKIDPAIAQAVVAAGGWRALARLIGVTYQGIQQWKRVPADRLLQVEAVTGIPRNVLRPDLFANIPKARKSK